MKGKRIFAAIDVSDEAKAQITEYIDDLRRDFKHLQIGWERKEKLHITLKFAGYLSDDELNDFTTIAQAAAADVTPFDVKIYGTGSFVRRKGQGILWLGLEAEPLVRLSSAFDQFSDSKNERPARAFNPHLTIARLRQTRDSRELIARHLASKLGPLVFRADEMVVFESRFLPAGSVYRAVSRHPFHRRETI